LKEMPKSAQHDVRSLLSKVRTGLKSHDVAAKLDLHVRPDGRGVGISANGHYRALPNLPDFRKHIQTLTSHQKTLGITVSKKSEKMAKNDLVQADLAELEADASPSPGSKEVKAAPAAFDPDEIKSSPAPKEEEVEEEVEAIAGAEAAPKEEVEEIVKIPGSKEVKAAPAPVTPEEVKEELKKAATSPAPVGEIAAIAEEVKATKKKKCKTKAVTVVPEEPASFVNDVVPEEPDPEEPPKLDEEEEEEKSVSVGPKTWVQRFKKSAGSHLIEFFTVPIKFAFWTSGMMLLFISVKYLSHGGAVGHFVWMFLLSIVFLFIGTLKLPYGSLSD